MKHVCLRMTATLCNRKILWAHATNNWTLSAHAVTLSHGNGNSVTSALRLTAITPKAVLNYVRKLAPADPYTRPLTIHDSWQSLSATLQQ